MSSSTSSPARSSGEKSRNESGDKEEDFHYQPDPAIEAAVDSAILSHEEEELHNLTYRRFEVQLKTELEERYPDDEEMRTIKLRGTLAIAKRRIPRRAAAINLYEAVKGRVTRLTASLMSLRGTAETGEIPPDTQARALLDIQRWETSLEAEFLETQRRLEAAYYGLDKLNDPLSVQADQIRSVLNDAMAPFRHPKSPAKQPAAPATATSAPTPSTTPAVVTARAFVVKDYVPVPFTGEGDPKDILGGFRSWEAEWEDAKTNLDKCPGVTAPIRLTKLQTALGGAALKLVKGIPMETEDGYDLAVKKLRDTYHNPVGLATALLKAAESDPRARCFSETDAHIRSLRAAMKEEDVELEVFYFLQPILDRLSPKDAASWAKYIVSQRTRYKTEQQRIPEDARVPWKVGMAYNVESFSNWREEALPDQQPAEEAGVHLAGANFPGRASSDQDEGGCAFHGWSSPHLSSACLSIQRMDSPTWINTVIAVNACVRCGRRYHRDHRCGAEACSLCGEKGHAAFRCGRHAADRAAYAAARAREARSPAFGRRAAEAGPSSAPKRTKYSPRGAPRGRGHRGGRGGGKSSESSPAASRQPPLPPPSSSYTPRGKGRGKKSAAEKQKIPPKE